MVRRLREWPPSRRSGPAIDLVVKGLISPPALELTVKKIINNKADAVGE
jgi:hypothetical protein